jgi:hypothetical protein
VAVIVAIVIVVGGLGYYFLAAAPNVAVSNIFVWAPDNVCGLNTNPIYYSGFNASTGSTESFILVVPNSNSTSCTLNSVLTNSSGFSVNPTGLPLVIPAGGNGNLTVDIAVPSSSFSGDLNLIYS